LGDALSKMVKRMPWEDAPPEDGDAEQRPPTPMSLNDLPDDVRHMVTLRPRRNPRVEWELDEETGLVTLVYPKSFSNFETALGMLVGRVGEIRRPLDGPGSFIWQMCDGKNDIAIICTAVDDAYKEEMEPVLKRVVGFIKLLGERGLIDVTRETDEAQAEG
jgi:hypothetical protein